MKYDCPWITMPDVLLVVSLLLPVTAVMVTTSPSDRLEVSATVTSPVASIAVAAIDVAGLPKPTLYTPDAAAMDGSKPVNEAVKVASFVEPLPSQYKRSFAI